MISTKLCVSLPDFIFFIYYHQAIDLVESKIYKPLPPKLKKKPPENSGSIFFQNKGVEFMKISCILRDPGTVKSFPKLPIQFPMPVVTYTPTIVIYNFINLLFQSVF